MSVNVPLLGKGAHQSYRRCIVALLVGGTDINQSETDLSVGMNRPGFAGGSNS